MKKYIFIGIIFIFFCITGIYLDSYLFNLAKHDPTPEKINVSTTATNTPPFLTIYNEIIKIEIADTEAERQQGLSDREFLPLDTGLLFIFEQPSQLGFWMKDMNFPIDIIWLDQNFNIVYIKENADPKRYPEVYSNQTPAQYVLETNTGFVEEHSLKLGDHLDFTLTK